MKQNRIGARAPELGNRGAAVLEDGVGDGHLRRYPQLSTRNRSPEGRRENQVRIAVGERGVEVPVSGAQRLLEDSRARDASPTSEPDAQRRRRLSRLDSLR